MKYSIEGFSQEYALSLKKTITTSNGKEQQIKVDFTDLVILRWFVDFYPNMHKMTVDGKEYALLSHGKMLEDLPLLDISKRACVERMQKLVKLEILDYRLVKDGGTFSLYTFGKNYIGLVKNGACEKNTPYTFDHTRCAFDDIGGIRSTTHPVYVQPDNKDKSIIHSSINTSNYIYNTKLTTNNNILTKTEKSQETDEKSETSKADENFERLWKMLPSTQYDRKGSVSKKRKKELLKMGEEADKAISVYLNTVNRKYLYKRDRFFNEIIDNYIGKTEADFANCSTAETKKAKSNLQECYSVLDEWVKNGGE